MAWRGDFQLFIFNEHLGDDASDLNAPGYTWENNFSSTKNFTISTPPDEESGYVLINAWGVHERNLRVYINGEGYSTYAERETSDWQLFMVPINYDAFQQGGNSIQIRRDTSGGDNLLIGAVVVHWREND